MRALGPLDIERKGLLRAAVVGSAIREYLYCFLEARGCDVEDSAIRYGATGYGPSIYLTDPEGNTVELKGPST